MGDNSMSPADFAAMANNNDFNGNGANPFCNCGSCVSC